MSIESSKELSHKQSAPFLASKLKLAAGKEAFLFLKYTVFL